MKPGNDPGELVHWQRVSPVAVVFFALHGLRRLIGASANLAPLLVVVVFNETLRQLAIQYGPPAALLLLTGGALAWYLTFLYAVSDERILLRQGVVRRRTLSLDYQRVQQADVQVPWYYRPFGLAVLSLDSAGASGETLHLSGIPAARAEALREQILIARAQAGPAAAEAEEPGLNADFSLSLPLCEVLRYGLMRNTLLVLLPVLAPFSEILLRRLEEVIAVIAPNWLTAETLAGGQRFLAVGGLLLGLVLLMAVVSMGLGLVRYHGYQLERHGEQFRYRAGLMTVLTRSVRRQRIQMVTVRLSWMGRLMGRHSLMISKAGDRQAGQDTEHFVVPVLHRCALQNLMQELHLPLQPDWQRPHAGAMLTGIGRWWGFGALLIGSLMLQGAPGGVLLSLAAVTFVISMLAALGWWRLRLCREAKWVGLRQGVLGRTVRWLPTARVQSVSLLQPLWQRRLGLASLDVRAASGRIVLPWIPRRQAERWRDELLCEVASGDIL
ncbi:PH domain-containing protein [Halomonas sp. BLK-85]